MEQYAPYLGRAGSTTRSSNPIITPHVCTVPYFATSSKPPIRASSLDQGFSRFSPSCAQLYEDEFLKGLVPRLGVPCTKSHSKCQWCHKKLSTRTMLEHSNSNRYLGGAMPRTFWTKVWHVIVSWIYGIKNPELERIHSPPGGTCSVHTNSQQ